MKFVKAEITQAAVQAGLSDAQLDQLWQALQATHQNQTRAKLIIALLYAGSLILFLSVFWLYAFKQVGLVSFFIPLANAVIFLSASVYFWHRKKWRMPGGMLAAFGIAMIPLTVEALQHWLHWWPLLPPGTTDNFFLWIQRDWMPMNLSTLLVASLVFYFIRFPFLITLIYATIWLVARNAIETLNPHMTFTTQEMIASLTLGILLNSLGFVFYRKNKPDLGFWSYLFGMFLCCLGLYDWDIQTQWSYFIYCLIHCGFLLVSGFFHRQIFIFFGSLGIIYYISHLVYLFSYSLLVSCLLGAFGFSMMILAVFLLRSKPSGYTEIT